MAIKFLNTVAVDTDVLYVDTTNNRVGIGTTSPARNLHVHASALTDIHITNDDTGSGSGDGGTITMAALDLLINNREAANIQLRTSGTEKMRITSGGNVGIGTTSPNGNLQFSNDVETRKIVLWEGYDNDYQFYGFGVESSTLVYTTYGAGDDHVFFVGASATSRNELMRIKSTGNVGIGTDDPLQKLHVEGNIELQANWEIGSTSGNYWQRIRTEDASATTTNAFNFETRNGSGNYIPHVVIRNDGNVGIGTTSPVYKLDVDGDIRAKENIRVFGNSVSPPTYNAPTETSVNLGTYINDFAYIDLASTSAGGSWIDFSKGDGTDYAGRIRYANSSDQFQISTAGSQKMVIDSNGKVGIGTTSPYSALQVGDTEQTTAAELTIASRYGSSAPILNFRSGHASNNNTWNMARIVATDDGNYNGRLEFRTTASAGHQGNEPQVKMVIKATGNVGIGTTAPSQKLHVAGNMYLSGVLYIGSRGIYQQQNTDVSGLELVANASTSLYRAAFFDYVIQKQGNVRAGTVFACNDGTSVEYTETSTNDIGDTSDVVLSVDISGTNMRLLADAATSGWSVKSLIRAI